MSIPVVPRSSSPEMVSTETHQHRLVAAATSCDRRRGTTPWWSLDAEWGWRCWISSHSPAPLWSLSRPRVLSKIELDARWSSDVPPSLPTIVASKRRLITASCIDASHRIIDRRVMPVGSAGRTVSGTVESAGTRCAQPSLRGARSPRAREIFLHRSV